MRPRMPKTREEWQEAVDWADGLLALDSCRMYGLVTGGPEVFIARCEYILRRGRTKGILPSPGNRALVIEALMVLDSRGPVSKPGGVGTGGQDANGR
jgi:hypothetical protein